MFECTREHAHGKVQLNPRGEINIAITISAAILEANHLISVTSSFSKSSVMKMFSVHTKTQSSVFKFLRLQEHFRETPFSVDNFCGLVQTEGLTREIKRRFQIPPGQCGGGLRFVLLRIFAIFVFVNKIEIKDPRKIKRSDDGRTYDVKNQFAGFFFFLNHKRVRKNRKY